MSSRTREVLKTKTRKKKQPHQPDFILPSSSNAIELDWYLTRAMGKASCAIHSGIGTTETLERDLVGWLRSTQHSEQNGTLDRVANRYAGTCLEPPVDANVVDGAHIKTGQ
jgi:hypothetical protein